MICVGCWVLAVCLLFVVLAVCWLFVGCWMLGGASRYTYYLLEANERKLRALVAEAAAATTAAPAATGAAAAVKKGQ